MANGWADFTRLQVQAAVATQVGYGATLFAGQLFQLTVVAALPTWAPFAGAALVGGLLFASSKYVITPVICWAENNGVIEKSDFEVDLRNKVANIQLAGTLLFAPVLGAWTLNWVLAWSLALAPMFYVGVVTALIAAILVLVLKHSCLSSTNEQAMMVGGSKEDSDDDQYKNRYSEKDLQFLADGDVPYGQSPQHNNTQHRFGAISLTKHSIYKAPSQSKLVDPSFFNRVYPDHSYGDYDEFVFE